MTYSSIYGPLTGRDQIAQQVLNLLQTPPEGTAYPLVVYFLAEVERQQGLQRRTIPTPQSYRIGLDFEVFIGDDLPLLTAVAQPTGDAERYDAGTYGQWYEIQVGATCQDPDGDERVAQQIADWYGAAIMGLLAKNGGLGNPTAFTVDKTVLVSSPKTEFVDGADRNYARSVTVVHSFVEVVTTEQGPTTYPTDPYLAPTDWPSVTVVKTELESEDLLGVFSPGSGVNVTDAPGHVIVTE